MRTSRGLQIASLIVLLLVLLLLSPVIIAVLSIYSHVQQLYYYLLSSLSIPLHPLRIHANSLVPIPVHSLPWPMSLLLSDIYSPRSMPMKPLVVSATDQTTQFNPCTHYLSSWLFNACLGLLLLLLIKTYAHHLRSIKNVSQPCMRVSATLYDSIVEYAQKVPGISTALVTTLQLNRALLMPAVEVFNYDIDRRVEEKIEAPPVKPTPRRKRETTLSKSNHKPSIQKRLRSTSVTKTKTPQPLNLVKSVRNGQKSTVVTEDGASSTEASVWLNAKEKTKDTSGKRYHPVQHKSLVNPQKCNSQLKKVCLYRQPPAISPILPLEAPLLGMDSTPMTSDDENNDASQLPSPILPLSQPTIINWYSPFSTGLDLDILPTSKVASHVYGKRILEAFPLTTHPPVSRSTLYPSDLYANNDSELSTTGIQKSHCYRTQSHPYNAAHPLGPIGKKGAWIHPLSCPPINIVGIDSNPSSQEDTVPFFSFFDSQLPCKVYTA
ncbi:hypothetical protein BDF14DRAFT_1857805 [Spinellus fusiger]|nr:hypothetical protein BDF14DRAFT_1857805 [Spinellus fusiger]